ncbi:MAG: glycosyltransferase family 1 protein [Oscillatoriales cyanobacterium]|nr:MAG: glycosyltransferase family 1 protein [Oscillatoriales cyanobacterium]
MHIAWLGKKSPFCGNVTYSREITNALTDRGYDVSFFHFSHEATPDGWISSHSANSTPIENHGVAGSANSAAKSNALVANASTSKRCDVSLPCLHKSTLYTIPTLKSRKVLTEALRQLKPDIVHASLALSPIDFVLPDICNELGLPVVATFHPPFDRRRWNITSNTQHFAYQLYASGLAKYDTTIVFSQIQRDLLVRLGVPPDRVAVIPNGVDSQKYSPGSSDLKLQVRAERVFVYQGRIAIEKNVESLLKAWKLSNMGDKCRLLIVGDGTLTDSLRSNADEAHGIQWLGYIADEQRRIEILRGADVFILPSFVEGLSLSLLEAMSCGVACVATDVGADGEALEGAGIVLDPQRVTTELQTLLPLLRDHPEMAGILGYKARQRVLERYRLDSNVSQLEALYARLLNRELGCDEPTQTLVKPSIEL